MKSKITLAAITAVTAFALLSVSGFQLNEIIAEEDEDKGYTFAENTDITAIFEYKTGTEVVKFQVFDQVSGWDVRDAPKFHVEKVVTGDTPMLMRAADDAQKYRSMSTNINFITTEFDVQIILAQGGEVVREFHYEDCKMTSNKVITQHDKEEGWTTSKGFVVTDEYDFTCEGLQPNNPTYEQMNGNYKKSTAQSSLTLKEPSETWESHSKFQSTAFGN